LLADRDGGRGGRAARSLTASIHMNAASSLSWFSTEESRTLTRAWEAEECDRASRVPRSTAPGSTSSNCRDVLPISLLKRIAIYKGLPLYPDPHTLVPVATEGMRTAMRTVFEVVAHENPFPAENFPQSAWNHMVLKTLFIDSVLHPIVGLDERWNDELAGIVVNYAHERWAAHRPVTPELWRGVGPFADATAISDLARVVVEGDPLEQKAAALALAVSRDPEAAQALARRRDLADAVAAGEITWERRASQTPLI
jgi:hypothetical protein